MSVTAQREAAGLEVSVGALLWAAAGVLFVGLRLAAMIGTPVGGPELAHLSGAWLAHLGVEDGRFVGALPQAVAAFTFFFTDSELPARFVAFAVTATVPVGLYLLRPRLGDAGALVALALLALDPLGIALNATSSAVAYDTALVVWIAVAAARWPDGRRWAAPIGFLAATCGPSTLPLLAAVLVCVGTPSRLREVDWRGAARSPLAQGIAGAAAGILVASAGFGAGFDGLAVPPLELFAAGFEDEWASASAGELIVLYTAPLLAAGAAVGGGIVAQRLRGGRLSGGDALLLAWTGFAGGWLVLSLGEENPVAVSAVNIPIALLLGPALVRLAGSLAGADWSRARFLLPAAGVFAVMALVPVLEWADRGSTGDSAEQARVWLFLALAAACCLASAYGPGRAVFLVVPAIVIGAPLLLAGATGTAFRWADEPFPSPFSPEQARDLRDTAVAIREEEGGEIAVHPLLYDDITWPFRDSGDVLVTTQPPLDAAAVLWPTSEAAPAGFEPLAGDWALLREVDEPTDSFLEYLNWLIDRNTLAIDSEPILVLTGSDE